MSRLLSEPDLEIWKISRGHMMAQRYRDHQKQRDHHWRLVSATCLLNVRI